MGRKRKGRRSIPRCSPEERSVVACTTREDLEAAALLSGRLVCRSKLSKSRCQSSPTTSRHFPPAKPRKRKTLAEKDALQVLSHGFPGDDCSLTSAGQAKLGTREVDSPNARIAQHQAHPPPTGSSVVCVTPDADKMKEEERQKRALDVNCSTEAAPVGCSDKEPMTSAMLQEGLQILSSVFLIASNSLIDQKKYLPDSIVPVADYSYDEHDEEKMDEQAVTLRREFSYLLCDKEHQRANFVALPKDVLHLLRGVWNFSEDPSASDRVGKRLVPVQSFFPNLLNYLLRTPGFPTSADMFDGDIFRPAGKKKVKAIEKEFKALLENTMENMGYPCSGREIDFYLSFMRTRKRTCVQDPHLDFKYERVDPWFVDESPTARRRTGRGKRLGYKERVPFIAFFPLTPDGMAVEVWEARDDHRSGRPGVLVHIPYGCMMMARGDLVHAGGFSNSKRGNPRCHLYIYRSGGEVHDINTSNSYTMDIDGKTMRMSQLYQHGPGI